MSDRALVIGLDVYANPAWELRAAVRDALAFAKWVTAPGAGRATEETLTLLLSPHPARPVDGMTFQLATDDAIWHALQDHKKNGEGAERLWFFYAGHGLAPPGGGPDEAPVVVPADVKDLDRYLSRPIDLGSWIRDMQIRKPEYQLYFVDACRGIVVSEDAVTAMKTLFFDLSKVKDGSQARQAVLFATTAGQLANEQGLHGLFGGVLMEGLQGTGPALEADPATEEFVLTFEALADYTKHRIRGKSAAMRLMNKTLPTQEPAASMFRIEGPLELAHFKHRPCLPVKVFVEPEEATTVGTAGIRAYNEWKGAWERQAEKPAPLGVPVVWELSSSVHRLEIEARGFENWKQTVRVFEPMELRAALVPKATDSELMLGGEEGELESYTPAADADEPPDGAGLAAGQHGQLEVRARDRYARIEVFDAGGTRVEAAWERLDKTLPVGSYRVEIALPTEGPFVQSVLVTADEPEAIDIHPDSQLTRRLPPSVGMIQPHEGLSVPSEAFGVATTTHLGSLLAWAASAAQFEAGGHGQKLRALGIERLPTGGCFVRVLAGDARAPEPDPQGGPIETLLLDLAWPRADLKPVPALEGFAMQWSAPVLFHTSLTLQTGAVNPKRMPLPFLAGHVWTIVIVRESTHRTEIHRYLQRLDPVQPFDDTIRLVEQNWRALDARTPLYDGEAARLLGRDLDPLSLAILGYRLALERRWEEVAEVVSRLGTVELADADVLAALVGERDTNMKRALESPTVPIVGEGYRLMEAWVTEHFAKQNMPPPIAPEPFTGGLWTAFDPRGEAVISKAFPVRSAPAWAMPLVVAAEATARIEPGPGKQGPFIGTGFLIGPRALALTDFIAKEKPTTAVFDNERVVIQEIVGATDDDRHGALVRIAPVERAPLKIRWALPEIGTRIAVIGHPLITFTPSLVTLAAFTTYPTGEKMIMPGVIVSVEETKLTYECWTMAGVGGGPILDLATGEVIGIHHSGKYEGGAKKLGFGVPVTAIEALLKTPI